ncbi:MAG TPA: LysR family transcriptional regulator [Methylomirabilota bacterium]|jgi:DNA-binding transcriptional LysR family regulator|nr:LysR family transcriptional regulator [Methylomirabilota bacterium]
MALNLGQLRVFEAVTRAGSFAGAARRLGVTPPAVSLQIRQLEEAHGVRLFDRVRRRVRLTAAGQTLEPYAQRIVALAADAERALGETRRFATGRLRVVASGTSAAYYLPPLLTEFRRRYPGLRIHLDVENSQRVRERVLSLEDDVGVLGVETPHPDLVFELLAEDPLVVIVPPGHPWARRRRLSLAELIGQDLILREPGSASRQLVERRLLRLGAGRLPAMEIASNEVIKRAVEMGNGVSLMSAAIVRREVEAGHLRALPVRGERLARNIYLVYHRERRESPLIQALLKVARELGRGRRRRNRKELPLPRRGRGSG